MKQSGQGIYLVIIWEKSNDDVVWKPSHASVKREDEEMTDRLLNTLANDNSTRSMRTLDFLLTFHRALTCQQLADLIGFNPL